MKLRRLTLLFGFVAIGQLLQTTSALALNTQLLRPGTGQVQGFQVQTSETLPKFYLVLGIDVNYAHHPFQQTIIGSTKRLAGIVDQFATTDFLISYGLVDWLTLNLDMPLNIYHNIAPTFIPTRDKGGGDAGDLEFSAKFRAFDANTTPSHLGLAFVPFVTVPTGRESIFFGDKSATGGMMIVGDAQWFSNRIYINVGGRIRKTETITNLTVKNELLYGAGFTRPLVKAWDFNIIAELFGSTNFRRFATENISSPLEGLVVLQKKWMDKRLVANLGGGVGLTSGYGVPTFRVLTGVSYAWDLKPQHPAPLPEIIDVHGKINFEFDKAIIKPESYHLLDGVAEVLKAHPEITKILIEGHTDSKGTPAYNQKLSERRANALKQYLVDKGIDPSRMSTVGYGATQPIAPNKNPDGSDNPDGRAENRRSVFRIVERKPAR